MKKVEVKNPVLRGFNPDPSFIYVNGIFYLANSTFEYKPGVRIHYSSNLINWKEVGVLDDPEYLNLTGIPHSGGVWAPCLRYHEEEGLFYLLYTNFKSSYTPPFRDQDNYLVTAPDIRGPWSRPVHINASGYDPAIFFDDDGRAYITNMIWDYRAEPEKMSAGIILQEYDWKKQRMTGETKMIFKGTELGQTEGPNLFKRNGWYYLMTAEGGTSFGHTVTLARSRNIWGPYETHPDKYILVSGDSPLQKAGHASICCDRNGNWYMAYLCSRPLSNRQCNLGRETSIQKVEWHEDDWLYVKNDSRAPELSFYVDVEEDTSEEKISEQKERNYTFENRDFLEHFFVLREPFDNGRFSLTDRPGYLRMYGRESINSCIEQSLIVHRQLNHDFAAEAELEFKPQNFGHMAGLIYRYDEAHQYYCFMTRDEEKGNVVSTLGIDGFQFELLKKERQIPVKSTHIYLKLEVHDIEGQFYVSEDEKNWIKVGDKIDASRLSDDHAIGFTGAMVGMACQDLMYHEYPADFKKFIYRDL